MSESWRRKKYYKPRVLIGVERILDPQYDDALLCITGAQLEMLRNLTQYLHRRSTFVDSEHLGYYLCADNGDWDDIQAIVADLEETLMGCEEFTALFEAMLAQLQCICNNASLPGTDAGSVAPIVDVGLTDGVLIEDDPYADDTEISARRCAVAQLTYWQAWEWLTEFIQPLQENAMDVVVPIALGVISVLVGVTPLAIPAGMLIAFLSVLIDVWVDGSLVDVQNALWAHRDELTCAVYNGLSYDYSIAEQRATDVINDMVELSPIDLVVMRAMFAPWAIALASKAYTQGTDWAVANVSSGACDDCTWVYQAEYEFPPSPGTWTGGFPTYAGRWPGLNGSEEGISPGFSLPSIVDHVDVEFEVHYMSVLNTGNTVGYVTIQYQDVALDWHDVSQISCTTNGLAGTININTHLDADKTFTTNTLRIRMRGQPGQSQTNPWPFMPMYIKIKAYPHV